MISCQYKLKYKKKSNCAKGNYDYKCSKLDMLITEAVCEMCKFKPE